MGQQNQYKMDNLSNIRDFFLTVLTGGIPMTLIREVCEDIEIAPENIQKIGINQYWLILREFAPTVADCLAFDQLVLSFKEFENIDSDLLPVSNRDAFSFLTQLRDDELKFALGSLSDNPLVIYELYNLVVDGDFDAYKKYLYANQISTYLLNKRIALYVLNSKSINEGQKMVKNAFTMSDDEIGLTEYAYMEKLKNASPDLIDRKMGNILSMIETAEKDESISDDHVMQFLEYPLYLIKSTIKDAELKEEKELNPYEKKLLVLRSSPYYPILEKINFCLENTILNTDKNKLWSAVNIIQECNEAFEMKRDDTADANRLIKSETLQKEDSFSIPSSYSSVGNHLDFCSRLTSEKQMTPSPVSAQEQEPILREIYNLYGGLFEDITCEEFLYLFGASFVKRPPVYSPPYYWKGTVSSMKALLRILYLQQPRILKELILHISDKETGAKSHDWGRNKNRVAYRDIESNIIKIVHRVTGKTLKEL